MPFEMDTFNPATLTVLFNLTDIQTGFSSQLFRDNPLFVKNYLCHLSPQVTDIIIKMPVVEN
jgi:hypothetical protein